MSYAEALPDDDVFSWNHWQLDPRLAAVSEKSAPEHVKIGADDPTIDEAAKRINDLIDGAHPPDLELPAGAELVPTDLGVGTVLRYEREYLTDCGHPNIYTVHAQLNEQRVIKKDMLGSNPKTPSHWNDPEPGMHWAYRYDSETGWGIVLPTTSNSRAIFGLKRFSAPVKSTNVSGSFGAAFVAGVSESGFSYESLRLPIHDRCPIGLSTLSTKFTRTENDPSRSAMHRVERINSVQLWLPHRFAK